MPRRGVIKKGNVLHLNRVRVDSEAIKFPIHKLAARSSKGVSININAVDQAGRTIRWKVSPNPEYGHPGELAYKLDTLIINKRIDDARSRGDIPKLLKLGSLNEIAEEITESKGGRGHNQIKKALLQNASVFIVADFSYTTPTGEIRSLKIADTRYGIILTGEKLPDGRKANQVYALLHDSFVAFLNTSRTRPLDYDYLKMLPPASQRIYELITPLIFACIKHENAHARYRYSDFCTFSGLTRYDTWDQVKKQMYKVMKPHKDSGYIKSVCYEETVDSFRRIDWEMLIVPGECAKREYAGFTGEGFVTVPHEPVQVMLPLSTPTTESTATQKLTQALRGFGVSPMSAQTLAQMFPERAKLWTDIAAKGCLPKKVKEPGAYLVTAIESDYAPPKAYKDLVKATEKQRTPSMPRRPKMPPPSSPELTDLPPLTPLERIALELEVIEAAGAMASVVKTWDRNGAPFLSLLKAHIAAKQGRG